jgi:hypothetical protein
MTKINFPVAHIKFLILPISQARLQVFYKIGQVGRQKT